ncbi:MAG: Asp-tRNA(Asn)/Glu-tRNA(Gln) amidotransferase subunit GatC [bacterium]|nr:Asp-tRNA(Asn)/Glu-tRNA(Gln) amidotransferase subunit GatC [bacterium]
MELSREEVRSIAELAKLDLTDDEVALYAGQLSSILGYFRMLQAVDTSHIAPTASVLPLKNVFRADAAGVVLPLTDSLRNAHDTDGEQFRVSAIFDGD